MVIHPVAVEIIQLGPALSILKNKYLISPEQSAQHVHTYHLVSEVSELSQYRHHG